MKALNKLPNTYLQYLLLFLGIGFCTFLPYKTYAQLGILASSISDQAIPGFSTTAAPPFTLNTASIDYEPNQNSNTTGPWQLTAVVADNNYGAYNAMLYVTDNYNAGWLSATIPSGTGYMYPDVAIANNPSPSTDYIIGVVANIASDVYLFTYSVTNQGNLGFAVTLSSYTDISNTGNVVGAPHIDIIAEYNNPFPGTSLTPKPYCDYYAITWQDASSGIMGCYGQLSNPGTRTIFVVDPSTTAFNPDVAAVQRYNGSTPGFEHWGLFTYLDAGTSPVSLVETEWELSPSMTFGSSTVYDQDDYTLGGNSSLNLAAPRIDAIDDYSNNTSANAYFDIVVAGMGGAGGSLPAPPYWKFIYTGV